MNTEGINKNIENGILGLVVADALGVPYEFKEREYFDQNPVIDMEGYGTYHQAPGTWSDDSSLTLATLDGLCYSKSFKNFSKEDNLSDFIDYDNIMDKFLGWLINSDYTPYNNTFDVGNATKIAIFNYKNGSNPLLSGGIDERSNGNGSLMRILPLAFFIYYLSKKHDFSLDNQMETIHNLSSLTHRHRRSQMACGIYILIAFEFLKNQESSNKLHLLNIVNNGIKLAKDYYTINEDFASEITYFDRIFSFNIGNLERDEIKSSGYVLDSLEASIWCLLNNNSYNETVLEAVNLGYDTDTTAAIAGGLAGIYYTIDDIPNEWLNKIAKIDYIESLINKFTSFLIDNME